jgi:hypothetical protein
MSWNLEDLINHWNDQHAGITRDAIGIFSPIYTRGYRCGVDDCQLIFASEIVSDAHKCQMKGEELGNTSAVDEEDVIDSETEEADEPELMALYDSEDSLSSGVLLTSGGRDMMSLEYGCDSSTSPIKEVCPPEASCRSVYNSPSDLSHSPMEDGLPEDAPVNHLEPEQMEEKRERDFSPSPINDVIKPGDSRRLEYYPTSDDDLQTTDESDCSMEDGLPKNAPFNHVEPEQIEEKRERDSSPSSIKDIIRPGDLPLSVDYPTSDDDLRTTDDEEEEEEEAEAHYRARRQHDQFDEGPRVDHVDLLKEESECRTRQHDQSDLGPRVDHVDLPEQEEGELSRLEQVKPRDWPSFWSEGNSFHGFPTPSSQSPLTQSSTRPLQTLEEEVEKEASTAKQFATLDEVEDSSDRLSPWEGSVASGDHVQAWYSGNIYACSICGPRQKYNSYNFLVDHLKDEHGIDHHREDIDTHVFRLSQPMFHICLECTNDNKIERDEYFIIHHLHNAHRRTFEQYESKFSAVLTDRGRPSSVETVYTLTPTTPLKKTWELRNRSKTPPARKSPEKTKEKTRGRSRTPTSTPMQKELPSPFPRTPQGTRQQPNRRSKTPVVEVSPPPTVTTNSGSRSATPAAEPLGMGKKKSTKRKASLTPARMTPRKKNIRIRGSHWTDGCNLWCPQEGCDYQFSSRDTLTKHWKTFHNGTAFDIPIFKSEIKEFLCELCSVKVNWHRDAIRNHVQKKHEITIVEYESRYHPEQNKK